MVGNYIEPYTTMYDQEEKLFKMQPQPIVVNDTVYIYYAGLNFPHDASPSGDAALQTGGVALATLKRDRFGRCDVDLTDVPSSPGRSI